VHGDWVPGMYSVLPSLLSADASRNLCSIELHFRVHLLLLVVLGTNPERSHFRLDLVVKSGQYGNTDYNNHDYTKNSETDDPPEFAIQRIRLQEHNKRR